MHPPPLSHCYVLSSLCRQRNLLERLGALEEAYGQQMQRLKGYMPASAFSRLRGRLGAGLGAGGSVLQRMELLEEGLELLLRAQELSWQSDQPRRRDRCCGGCTICCCSCCFAKWGVGHQSMCRCASAVAPPTANGSCCIGLEKVPKGQ